MGSEVLETSLFSGPALLEGGVHLLVALLSPTLHGVRYPFPPAASTGEVYCTKWQLVCEKGLACSCFSNLWYFIFTLTINMHFTRVVNALFISVVFKRWINEWTVYEIYLSLFLFKICRFTSCKIEENFSWNIHVKISACGERSGKRRQTVAFWVNQRCW